MPGRKITGLSPLFLHHHILAAADEGPAARLGDDYLHATFAADIPLAHLIWHRSLLYNIVASDE
jgi:hypothetical protein